MKTVVEKQHQKDLTIAIVKNGDKFQAVYLHKLISGKWQSTVCGDFIKVSDDSDENIIKALNGIGSPAEFNGFESARDFINLNASAK